MALIDVPQGLPGIIGLLAKFPKTAHPLSLLAETLLTKGTDGFSVTERETLASYVSFLNDCQFCSESHAAVADAHAKERGFAKKLWETLDASSVTPRFRALMKIAAKVQKGGRGVTVDDVAMATREGATQAEVHDAVLIAAAFCMYNRYVDGLATIAPPRGSDAYIAMGADLAATGYMKTF
ncbi:MAG: carboxymuconolactone decarboxylase [Bdellovibrionota bacterium]